MNDDYLHYKGWTPATADQKAEAARNAVVKSAAKAAEKEAERERSRLSNIEYMKRWDATFAAMGLDDIIEIPCTENGEKVMSRFHARGGRLIPVED